MSQALLSHGMKTKKFDGKTIITTFVEGMNFFCWPFCDATNPWMVSIGNTQSTVYSADDVGPFELSVGEKK